MKRAIVGILAGLAAHAPLVAEVAGSQVRFANGDRLEGSVESLSPEALVWTSPLLEKPVPFDLKQVLDLTVEADPELTKADHEATLSLTNGDLVRGRLVSVTDETVALDTWYAGRMEFDRLMLEKISIEAVSELLYRGPAGMAGWVETREEPAWNYSRQAFRSHAAGGIGRDDLLPDEVSVSFDVAWRGDVLGLKVLLFSTDPKSETPGSGCELSFQRGSVSLRNGSTQGFVGSTRVQELLEDDRVRVEIRASVKSGSVSLYVNDEIVEVWQDPDLVGGRAGRGLQFVSPGANPLRISGIEVAPWDGVVTEIPQPQAGMMRQFGMEDLADLYLEQGEEKKMEGRMLLANGDSVAGEVTSIEGGMIRMDTSLGEIQVPVARFREVALKPVDLERCIRRSGDIRAWFSDDSSVVFRLDSVGDGTLTGSSQNFGEAVFKLSAFKRIEFNIYNPDYDGRRLSDAW